MHLLLQSFSLVILSCYFLPFFLFFFASLWLSSAAVFALSVAGLSITTLILFLAFRQRQQQQPRISAPIPQKQYPTWSKQKPIAAANSIFDLAKQSLGNAPTFNLSHQKEIIDALIKEQEELKANYDEQLVHFETELRTVQERTKEKELLFDEKSKQYTEMERLLRQTTEEAQALKTEVANLKFELFALCRIDEQILANKITCNNSRQKMKEPQDGVIEGSPG